MSSLLQGTGTNSSTAEPPYVETTTSTLKPSTGTKNIPNTAGLAIGIVLYAQYGTIDPLFMLHGTSKTHSFQDGGSRTRIRNGDDASPILYYYKSIRQTAKYNFHPSSVFCTIY